MGLHRVSNSEMDSGFAEETTKRQSSVISSEASSQISVSSGCEDETQMFLFKKKSASLSCLSDRMSSDFDHIVCTLPPNLRTVKQFKENLLSKSASSIRSIYKTAEGLERQKEELSRNDEQRLAFDVNNCDEINHEASSGMPNGNDPQEKRKGSLSEINTVTHTFVRTSALDILAQFPRMETISTVGGGNKHTKLNIVEEDLKDGTAESVPISKSADELSSRQQFETCEVNSWSSTSNIKKKPKKKVFNKKSKVTSKHSDSTEQLGNHNEAKSEKSNAHKENAKSARSAWLSPFLRSNKTRTKKNKKPLKKSESLNFDSLPKPQLNRMNSIRKLFKRPRDSDVLVEAKPVNNVKCVEISSPILKSDFRSKNLVDREVFIRERAYLVDVAKIKKVNDDSEVCASNTEAIANQRNGTYLDNDCHEQVSGNVVVYRYPKPQEIPEAQGSPIAPVRHKHLQKKWRLSMQNDALLQNDCSEDSVSDNHETYEQDPENNQDSLNFNSKKQKGIQDNKMDKTESTVDCSSKFRSVVNNNCKNDSNNPDKNIGLRETAFDCVAVNTCKSHHDHSEVGNELKTVTVDSVKNCGCVVIDVPQNSNETIDTSPGQGGQHTPTSPGDSQVGVGAPLKQASDNQASPLQSPHSEFEDVFVDSKSEENISFGSAAELVEKPQTVCQELSNADSIKLPAGRWNSDVGTRASQRAISKAIQKKPASFSGVRTSIGESTKGGSVATSSVLVARSPTSLVRRSSSTFRLPSTRFEATEPISLITDVVPVTFPNFLTDRRSQIVLELFTTERTYVRGLETMIELFEKPMLAGRMDEKDVETIFSNLNEIFAVNKDLLFLLWEKVKHWQSDTCIAQMFIDMEERFKIYATYCKNFDKSDSVLKQKIKRNKDFERFLKTCYSDPLCQPGLDLPAYLITVVQRIPRYLLMLKDLFKKTSSSHPDHATLERALTRMNKVAEYVNSQLQEVHSKKAMQELRSTVIGLKAYEVKGRTLLKEAEVCLMSPKKPYKCLLFNDIMVFAVQGSKDRSEIEMTLELKTLWFEDLKKQDPQTSKCDAIELYTPHRPYTLYACSRTDKRVWLQKLRTAIVTLLYGPDCEDPDGMDISRRKASDTYFDGSVYCGEYVNGKRHGQGVMAWPNRTRYEGTWADDERHGAGQLTYYTGEKYVGNWVAGKKEGEGRQAYVNNDVYHGEWKDGKMHGKGVIDFSNGDRYEGDMCNNEVEGDGEMTCTTGLVYKGQWKKSKRHGQGHMFLPNGNEYKGEMLNDRICGYGKMIYFNGDEYTGEWVNELRQGSGYFKFVNGTLYDGQWNQDFMNGQGKMTYPNGDEYTGTWYENKRVGKGQLIYAHGDTYNGQWEADTMNGKGVMYYKDGSVYEGEWLNGKSSGHGKTVYKDKRIYEGEYFLGFRHGRGQLIYPNNILYVGEWKWDKFDGNGVLNDPNTDYSYTGDWCCGMREGSGIEISYKTRYEGSWKANMKHGAGVEKSHAGHVFKGTWKENRKHGEGIRTLRSNVEEMQNWSEGHLIDGRETVAEGLPPLPRR